MKAVSLFAGIGGFDLALTRLGHDIVYVNEWDKYAADTYQKNFGVRPDTRSITAVSAGDIPTHDLLVGGFPCQAFSIAGKRKGFDEARGTLFFDIARILKHHQTKYFILENVKGLLSHDNGRTFKTIIKTLTELGYDCEWQVLNSKNFGVPQNRERVYIVGHLRGESRPEIFPFRQGDGVNEVVGEKTKRNGAFIIHNVYGGFGEEKIREFHDVSPTIRTPKGGGHIPMVVTGAPEYINGERTMKYHETDTVPTIRATQHKAGDNQPKIKMDGRIRKLTPIECERLQGFPDNWTQGVSDTQRYKQLGNAVTVNVVYEIVKRLKVGVETGLVPDFPVTNRMSSTEVR